MQLATQEHEQGHGRLVAPAIFGIRGKRGEQLAFIDGDERRFELLQAAEHRFVRWEG